MRNLIAVLSLVSISLTAMAKEKCSTVDLLAEQERISAIKDISQGERSLLMEGWYSAKMVQLLACVGMNRKINLADSDFGTKYMEDSLKTKIQKLEGQRSTLEGMLKDSELSQIEVDLYSRSLALIPGQIQAEQLSTASIVKGIKKLTRDF